MNSIKKIAAFILTLKKFQWTQKVESLWQEDDKSI